MLAASVSLPDYVRAGGALSVRKGDTGKQAEQDRNAERA